MLQRGIVNCLMKWVNSRDMCCSWRWRSNQTRLKLSKSHIIKKHTLTMFITVTTQAPRTQITHTIITLSSISISPHTNPTL